MGDLRFLDSRGVFSFLVECLASGLPTGQAGSPRMLSKERS